MTNGIRSETNGDNLFEYRTEFDYSDMVRRISEQSRRLIDEQAVEQVRARLAELGYRKCSECKERQGYYLDAETIQRQQESIAKLTVERDAYFEMVKRVQADCDARDELIRDMIRDFEEQMHGPTIYPQTWYVAHKILAQKLGIEV